MAFRPQKALPSYSCHSRLVFAPAMSSLLKQTGKQPHLGCTALNAFLSTATCPSVHPFFVQCQTSVAQDDTPQIPNQSLHVFEICLFSPAPKARFAITCVAKWRKSKIFNPDHLRQYLDSLILQPSPLMTSKDTAPAPMPEAAPSFPENHCLAIRQRDTVSCHQQNLWMRMRTNRHRGKKRLLHSKIKVEIRTTIMFPEIIVSSS